MATLLRGLNTRRLAFPAYIMAYSYRKRLYRAVISGQNADTMTASAPLSLVEIDDKTVQAYGQWPLPRDTYAGLLHVLDEAGATAIGVDLLFLDPNSAEPGRDTCWSRSRGAIPIWRWWGSI